MIHPVHLQTINNDIFLIQLSLAYFQIYGLVKITPAAYVRRIIEERKEWSHGFETNKRLATPYTSKDKVVKQNINTYTNATNT